MANTFLLAKGIGIGSSLCEPDLMDIAGGILATAGVAGCEIVLPEDVVVAAELVPGTATRTVGLTAIPDGMMVLDVGPKSADALARRLADCRTLVWNGPLGAFETEPFDRGTCSVALAAAKLTRGGKMISVAGGGDTMAALAHAGAAQDFTYVSAAGGAFLEWLEGKRLPGVEVLRKR